MDAKTIEKMSLEEILEIKPFKCECGKVHDSNGLTALIEHGAVKKIPELLALKGCVKPFILSGHDTFEAGGKKVCGILEQSNIPYSKYVFPKSPVLPTEETVGKAVMHYDYSCDCIIAVGTGVINDTAKFIAAMTQNEFFKVATAPSMDGFASATSSMERDGLKVSIDTCYAHTLIGDLDILCNAPMHLIVSGVGDMLAKYISLLEWKEANIIIGEYYCDVVAAMVRSALNKVVNAAPKLVERDADAVKSVMEGMVIAGLAMSWAGVSRTASGMEHYLSHIWDMRSLAFEGAQCELHGIQAGIGTLISLKTWEYISSITPDREKALAYAASFSSEDWNAELEKFVGPGAEAMIENEKREKKYDTAKHAARLEIILNSWDKITETAAGLPKYDDVLCLMKSIGAPVSAHDIGYTDGEIAQTFKMSKDIRDKYVGTRLLWDLGVLDDAAEELFS